MPLIPVLILMFASIMVGITGTLAFIVQPMDRVTVYHDSEFMCHTTEDTECKAVAIEAFIPK